MPIVTIEWYDGRSPEQKREIAEEKDDLRIVKLNVDDNQATAARYDVMSIPTLILFKNGEPAHKIIGALPKSRLVKEIEPALTA